MDELQNKLRAETGDADWPTLRPHHARGRLRVVDPRLDLVEVGVCVARDEVEQIARWITDGLITRPTNGQIERWENGATRLRSVVLAPYVFVQDWTPPSSLAS